MCVTDSGPARPSIVPRRPPVSATPPATSSAGTAAPSRSPRHRAGRRRPHGHFRPGLALSLHVRGHARRKLELDRDLWRVRAQHRGVASRLRQSRPAVGRRGGRRWRAASITSTLATPTVRTSRTRSFGRRSNRRHCQTWRASSAPQRCKSPSPGSSGGLGGGLGHIRLGLALCALAAAWTPSSNAWLRSRRSRARRAHPPIRRWDAAHTQH